MSEIPRSWSDAFPLDSYSKAPAQSGVYVIGSSGMIPGGPISSGKSDFLGSNWPDNFLPAYVGESERSVRTRLSRHARGRGNACVWKLKEKGVPLYFITTEIQVASIPNLLELVLTLLRRPGQFECNERNELKRATDRQRKRILEKMSPAELDWYHYGEYDPHEGL